MAEQRERAAAERETFKRRGILAAAGAAIAAIVVKQSAEPVLAASLTLDTNNASTGNTNIHGPGDFAPWSPASGFTLKPVLSANNTSNDGITVQATRYALYGETTGGLIGVTGYATGIGYGVYGYSAGSYGVYGLSSSGNGVYGSTSGTSTVAGGNFSSASAYGVIGTSFAAGYSGLTGITSTPGVAALAATATVANAYAAYFQGTTVVQGNFIAFGGSKSAAVPHPDGSHRLVYCVESPESWFEDFGEAKLVGGTADVRLDPDFAAVVHTDAYHVFLTPHGDTNGLHVANRAASGFSVAEHKGGTGSLSFSWRVVAKRKDIKGERLATFDLPKINHPDPAQLPKPEAPKKP